MRVYRGLLFVIFTFIAVCLFASSNAYATDTVPHRVNFQGRLTTSSGVAVPDGTYNMRLTLYDSPTGGSNAWTSSRLVSAGEGVQVTNGQFAIQLGRLVVLSPDLFDGSSSLYLEVELPTPATATSSSPVWAEGPMTPRNQLLTSAYSLNADQIDGLDSTELGTLAGNNIFSGNQQFNGGQVSIGGTADSQKFNVANLFRVDSSASQIVIGSIDSVGTLLVLDTKNTSGDPTGTNGAIYYNSSTGKFRCYEEDAWKDCIGTRQVRSFIDTTADSAADNNTTNYWDLSAENNSSYPNLTPSTANKSISGTVTFETSSTTTADRSIVTRIERSIGSPAACNSGTPVGSILSTFTTNTGEQASNTTMFIDEPATTSKVYYTLCADSATSGSSGMTINRVRFTLEEANNSNS